MLAVTLALALCAARSAWPHGVSERDAGFVINAAGSHVLAFMYLGAKHMLTGADHLLFLFGVIFFVYRPTQIALYVSLFALGHSVTLLLGVLGHWQVNAHAIDALIALSVVYKGFDNMGGFRTAFGAQPDLKAAVLGFGLIHGLGLAGKLQELHLAPQGLVPNLLAFNVGVELGQLLALSLMLLAIGWWRSRPAFARSAVAANTVLMGAGFVLMQFQLVAWRVSTP